MTHRLSDLDNQGYDVAVIGAGVNGSSAAQHLTAAGYRVLIVDKNDFAGGSSSRSSRLLHCGLRYLAPGSSMFEFVRHPSRFATACRMARQAMTSRSHFVSEMPDRVRRIRFNFPLYDNSPYRPWQLTSAFALLRMLGPKDVPLDYQHLDPDHAAKTPLVKELRDQANLKSVAGFREYQFDWPERVVVDNVLDAERMGASVRNYAAVTGMVRRGGWWQLTLRDELHDEPTQVTVDARAVVNMAGIWIDEVNGMSHTGRPARRITGTKGTHIAVQLPQECSDFGIATLNRESEPFYCVPWRGLHYFGPTETLYEEDLDQIMPNEIELAWLLDEANFILPGLQLKRSDVIYAWSGVRPLTYDPTQPMGARSRELHDLTDDGLPCVWAMTAGPVMTHQSGGQEVAAAVSERLAPSRSPQRISYASAALPSDRTPGPLIAGDDSVSHADIRRAAAQEHAQTLIDALFRRTGAGWHHTMALNVLDDAASIMADVCGWDEAQKATEIERYRHYVRVQHLHRDFENPCPG